MPKPRQRNDALAGNLAPAEQQLDEIVQQPGLPPKFSRRWLVTLMIRLPAKRRSSSASPPASAGSSPMRAVTQCSASITVLPVTWMRA
ncbi:MAG: hypothetical protein KDE49_11335, partial [Novosphingobium sp.]|nr:hypothetical protein [Novosphingobium sp.]